MQKDRPHQIPSVLVGVIGEVIGNALYSHGEIESLFLESGFDGSVPDGNCVRKCQAWLRSANQDTRRHPIDSLSVLLKNFTERFPPYNEHSDSYWKKIKQSLQANGFQFDGNELSWNQDDYPIHFTSTAPSIIRSTEIPVDRSDVSSAGPVIFLIHGHNHNLKNTVARFIEKLKLKVCILHEQAHSGRTIIENLESHSKDAHFAVALFTADDVGRAEHQASPNPRPRQNVVFEAGYFAGLLGRSRVCMICDDHIELPSDLAGLLYVPIHQWPSDLVAKLTQAGIKLQQDDIVNALAIR